VIPLVNNAAPCGHYADLHPIHAYLCPCKALAHACVRRDHEATVKLQ
jgi:hypothetical protein